MIFNREPIPVNLSYRNLNNENCKTRNLSSPFSNSRPCKKIDLDFDNLKEFRSKILKMDDEIQKLKNIELERQMYHQKSDNHAPELQYRPKLNLKDQSVSTESLFLEQTERVLELERQLDQLKRANLESKNDGYINREIINNEYNSNEKVPDYDKDFEDEIAQRIGTWTPKNPYQGPMQNLYFPFGSQGGGAPRRDNRGNIQATMISNENINVNSEERKKKYLASQFFQETMQQEMIQQKLRKLQDKQQIREPNEDFSELISTFKGGRPKRDPVTGILIDNHLPSSDVTNINLSAQIPNFSKSIQTNSSRDSGIKEYGMELARAAKERQILKHLDKLREQQEGKQHMRAWNSIWSPRDRSDMQRNYYSNNRPQIQSNHRNFYEMSNPTL